MSIKEIKFLNILFSTLTVEFICLVLFRFTNSFFSVKAINDWYDKLKWSAVILDILIVIIGFYLNIFISRKLNIKDYRYILILQLIIQIIHDLLFYYLFILKSKKGNNIIMDEFKSYAKNTKLGAIFGDSWMYLMGIPLLFISLKLNNEIMTFLCVSLLYIIGYLIYQKPSYSIPSYYLEIIIPILLNIINFFLF